MSITDSTPSSSIYYTTNGNTPVPPRPPSILGRLPLLVRRLLRPLAWSTASQRASLARPATTLRPPIETAAALPGITPARPEPALLSWAAASPCTNNTPGATQFFVTNGSTPTTSSQVYSGAPQNDPNKTTVKAIAAGNGFASKCGGLRLLHFASAQRLRQPSTR